jgi:uncharacterized membrane protein
MSTGLGAIALALMLCVTQAANAQPSGVLPALFNVADVAADDVLNVRLAPKGSAPIIGSLAPSATLIEVTALSADGQWGRINLGETAGWANLRFLRRDSSADWTEMTTPMTCSGTEPFWSLSMDSANGNLILSDMDQPLRPLEIDWLRQASGVPATIGFSLRSDTAKGFATLRGAECSDGMSDRLSSIAITLFLKGDGGPMGLVGCCNLAP